MAMALDSNIVGYTTKGVVANQKAISGAQFVEIGEAGLDLASIKLVNVDADGMASIMWWDGSKYESAAWIGLDWGDGEDGWGDENTDPVTYTFAAGEGFWIVLPSGVVGAQVTQAGEVGLSKLPSYNFDLAANKKFLVINPLPTALDLSEITLANVDADGMASIMWWDGSKYESAAWIGLDWGDGADGWGDENTDEVSYTFAVSEGFWVVLPGGVTDPQIKIINKVIL